MASILRASLALAALAGSARAYELAGRMAPEYASKPIPVVFWVKPGVIPADETRVLGQIRNAIKLWEDIPTCALSFTGYDILRTAAQPTAEGKGKLMVIVGNAADLTSGGATYAGAHGTGWWVGAVADKIPDITAVAVHEVGHALGLAHSTLSDVFHKDAPPAMHWAVSSPVPAADDIAALSTAYPDPVRHPRKEMACVSGRFLSTGPAPTAVGGMNVVALDAQGVPKVGGMSGFTGQRAGRFAICGIPPGTYDFRFLDGRSYRGLMDAGTGDLAEVRRDAQVDNAPEPAPVRRTLAAGDSADLGDIPVAIERIRPDSLVLGNVGVGFRGAFQPYAGPALPDAPVGKPYEAWVHLRGGLRRLIIADNQGTLKASLPPGLDVTLERDARTTGDAINGNAFLRIQGAPSKDGTYAFKVPIQDRRFLTDTVAFTLKVGTGVSLAPSAIRFGRGLAAKRTDALGRSRKSASKARP